MGAVGEWDLRRLRVLRAVDECGTVTAAAERLHLSPSAVSQQISALARQVGAPMLEPYGRRVRLTPAARLVLRHAAVVFGQLERAEAELAGYLHGEAGEVRVGAFATAITGLLVPAVARLREAAPRLTVRVVEAEADEVVRLLAAGDVDLALSLAVGPVGRGPGFVETELLSDPLDVALPPGHPLAGAPGLRLADLAAEPWIYGAAGPWREITTTACARAGFTPERAHTAADWTAIPADLPTRRVVAAVRAGTERTPPLRRVLAELAAVAELVAVAELTAAAGTLQSD